jgi:hypothetical protein
MDNSNTFTTGEDTCLVVSNLSFNSLCKEALSSGKKVIAVDADDVLASTNAKVAESGYCRRVSTFG